MLLVYQILVAAHQHCSQDGIALHACCAFIVSKFQTLDLVNLPMEGSKWRLAWPVAARLLLALIGSLTPSYHISTHVLC